MALILLARILVLVLALVVVAILKVLIAILTLIVSMLTLVVVPGVCLWGIILSFHSWGSDDSPPKRVLHGKGILPWHQDVFCWFGLFGRLLGLLTFFSWSTQTCCFALVGFGNLLLPSAIRAIAFCRAVAQLTTYSPLTHCRSSSSLTLSHNQSGLRLSVQFLQRIPCTHLCEGYKLDETPSEKHRPVFLSFGAELALASCLGLHPFSRTVQINFPFEV